MNKTDKKRFAQAFGTLCTVFGKENSSILSGAYFSILEQLEISQVEKAISKAAATLRFFPKPVELIELSSRGQPKIEDQAIVQASEILAHLQRWGACRSPTIEDPITMHLMTRRWPYSNWAKNVLESELKWWEKEFCEAYRAYSETETNQSLSGLELPEPSEMVRNLIEGIG